MTAPLLGSLIDDFADGVIDPGMWPTRSGVIEQNDRAEFTKSAGALCTPTMYTLPGSAVFCRVHPPLGTTTTAQLVLETSGTVRAPGSNTAKFDTIRVIADRITGKLSWTHIKDLFTPKWSESILYDPTAYAWIQVREDGGGVFLETSPDGIGWTTQSVRPLPLGTLDQPGAVNWAAIGRFYGGALTTPGYITHLNVTP